MTRIAVIGAGPKALAIAAKNTALSELGFEAPEILVIDQTQVAAHWSGHHGYTDGRMSLGTPPEKDVGFPYVSTCWGEQSEAVNEWMLRYSWQAYLARGESPSGWTYSDWVDRGRPHPPHREWASYLQWVGHKLGLEVQRGRVTEIGLDSRQWKITAETEAGREELPLFDALVVTGPGPPLPICEPQPDDARVLDGRSYWHQVDSLRSAGPLSICVAGGGETAAAVVVSLVNTVQPGSSIEIITPHAITYSRGESYEENRRFSDPTGWKDLSEGDRLEFVRRTDRGVFSLHAKSVIDSARNVETRAGYVRAIDHSGESIIVTVSYGGTSALHAYDCVICARGFDDMWFFDVFSEEARRELQNAVGRRGSSDFKDNLRRSIRSDLSVDHFTPCLHLPMLAGFRQGPGFPNLSSLGLLADRILDRHVRAATS